MIEMSVKKLVPVSYTHLDVYKRQGERYRLRDLLYSMMLESHNDSAAAIAEAVGGSVEDFADMMNRKAAELGCEDTYFLTPNGLDAKERKSGKIHSTTAADMARILRYGILFSPAKEEFLSLIHILVNFKNLNVLTDYFQKDIMRDAGGNVRHIILSEEGFTSKSATRGDVYDIQAAAFAYAYYLCLLYTSKAEKSCVTIFGSAALFGICREAQTAKIKLYF